MFGVKLERNGIHYELNGTHYQDTYDGCIRLKNAYRRFFEISNDTNQGRLPRNAVYLAWRKVVGMAQRHSMVHVIQRFCEEGRPFSPLFCNKKTLKDNFFIRTGKVTCTWSTEVSLYPLQMHWDLGFNFGLFKGGLLNAMGADWEAFFAEIAQVDSAAICLIDEVRIECFNERMRDLKQLLDSPSPDQSSDSGCIVM